MFHTTDSEPEVNMLGWTTYQQLRSSYDILFTFIMVQFPKKAQEWDTCAIIISVDSRLMTYCAMHMASGIHGNSHDMHLGTNNASCRKKALRCTIGMHDTQVTLWGLYVQELWVCICGYLVLLNENLLQNQRSHLLHFNSCQDYVHTGLMILAKCM